MIPFNMYSLFNNKNFILLFFCFYIGLKCCVFSSMEVSSVHYFELSQFFINMNEVDWMDIEF